MEQVATREVISQSKSWRTGRCGKTVLSSSPYLFTPPYIHSRSSHVSFLGIPGQETPQGFLFYYFYIKNRNTETMRSAQLNPCIYNMIIPPMQVSDELYIRKKQTQPRIRTQYFFVLLCPENRREFNCGILRGWKDFGINTNGKDAHTIFFLNETPVYIRRQCRQMWWNICRHWSINPPNYVG